MSKKYNHQFLLLFFGILYLVPMHWLLFENNDFQWSLIESRKVADFPQISLQEIKSDIKKIIYNKTHTDYSSLSITTNFIERSLQINFEQAVTDRFPLRIPLIKISKMIDRGIIRIAYAILQDPATPADMSSGLYVMRENLFLLERPGYFADSTQQTIDHRIDNFLDISEQYPELNVYVFYHQLLRNSEFHPLNAYFSNSDNGQAFDYFRRNLSGNINLGTLMLEDLDDHVEYYHRTDHHWNANGIMHAYYTIYGLISGDFEDISQPLIPIEYLTLDDLEFTGSFARQAYFPLHEKFTVPVIDFPPYKIVLNGNEIQHNKMYEYYNGNYDNTPYLNHYGEFYGVDRGLLIYEFDNASERNLLLIGSSHTNPLEPLLAYHYKYTYSVDLRWYPDFTLQQFLSQHAIDDLIIVGENIVLFRDDIWEIRP